MSKDIEYSDKYEDEFFEYRHVILPRETAKRLPNPARLLTESEWRGIGVQQSRGWAHYEIHKPEPHILLFRRPIGTDPITGKAPAANTIQQSTATMTSQQQQQQQQQAQQQLQKKPVVAQPAAIAAK